MLVACVVGEAESGTGGAVLWLVYDRPPIAAPVAAADKESARTTSIRERFLGSVLRTCERLGVVYEVLRSPLVESAEFVGDLAHDSSTFQSLANAADSLQRSCEVFAYCQNSGTIPASGSDTDPGTGMCRSSRTLQWNMIQMAVAHHLSYKSGNVAQHLGEFRTTSRDGLMNCGVNLQTYDGVTNAAKEFSRLEENGRFTDAASTPNVPKRIVDSMLSADSGPVGHGRALLLLFILCQVLRNIGLHQGLSAAPSQRLPFAIELIATRKPWIELQVSAGGGKLDRLWSVGSQEYAKRLPFKLGHKPGRGMDLIKRAARAIADSIKPDAPADFVPYELRNKAFNMGSGRRANGVVHILRIPTPKVSAAQVETVVRRSSTERAPK